MRRAQITYVRMPHGHNTFYRLSRYRCYRALAKIVTHDNRTGTRRDATALRRTESYRAQRESRFQFPLTPLI